MSESPDSTNRRPHGRLRRWWWRGVWLLLVAWIGFINCSDNQSHFLLLYLLALPFHLLGWLVFVRGIQAFGRQKG